MFKFMQVYINVCTFPDVENCLNFSKTIPLIAKSQSSLGLRFRNTFKLAECTFLFNTFCIVLALATIYSVNILLWGKFNVKTVGSWKKIAATVLRVSWRARRSHVITIWDTSCLSMLLCVCGTFPCEGSVTTRATCVELENHERLTWYHRRIVHVWNR